MGSGSYDSTRAVEDRTVLRSTNRPAFEYKGESGAKGRRGVHPLLDPSGQVRECVNDTPIVVALDVTRSRGDDSKIVYDALPDLFRHLQRNPYIPGPAISFAAIGDATFGDQAPCQISQFEADNRLDQALTKFWLEEGGGGSGQESYELIAYYYAHRTLLHCLQQGRKGFMFFLGDEAPYDKVRANQAKQVLGHDPGGDCDTAAIFAELQEKFHVFFLFPKATMAQRRGDIDAEMKQRVTSAGGRYEGVDIRASLLWNDRNDLDLYVIPPSGERIYYGHKQSVCGGWLDVDMNVRGESTKPVENVQWAKGTAPKGHYKICIQNYRYHERPAPIPYRAEIEINGTTHYFQDTISHKGETGIASEVVLFEFDFDPNERSSGSTRDPYANYKDEVILDKWRALLPDSHILRIQDPKTIVEVMAGVLAVTEGGSTVGEFIASMGRQCLQPLQTAMALDPLWRAWQEVY